VRWCWQDMSFGDVMAMMPQDMTQLDRASQAAWDSGIAEFHQMARALESGDWRTMAGFANAPLSSCFSQGESTSNKEPAGSTSDSPA
jgi:hypothetical protein